MDVENLALTIRAFFHHLLSSRYQSHLEEELLRTRSDYETRLLERERTISDLREQLSFLSSKVDRYEMVLLPLASPAGSLLATPRRPAPTFQSSTDTPAPTSWQEVQAQWDREQAAEAAKEKRDGNDQGRQAQVEQV